MANFTPNYNLRKPVGTEQFDIDRDFNANWDVIDGELKERETAITALEDGKADKTTTYTKTEVDTKDATKADKVMATNGISNGDFSNGTTGWGVFAGALSALNNILSLTGSGANVSPSVNQTTSIPLVNGHKVYVRALVKAKSSLHSSISILTYGNSPLVQIGTIATISSPMIDTQYLLSGVNVVGSQTTNLRIIISSSFANTTNATNSVTEIQCVSAFDLTTIFGAGNEPTKEQMDRLLAEFPNSWFDGTQEILPIKRMLELLDEKANKAQEAWQTPTLLNGWTVFSANDAQPGYYKDSLGNVHLKGIVKGGLTGQLNNIFTLPVGYRPSKNMFIPGINGNVFGILVIGANGNVYVFSGTVSSYFSFGSEVIFKGEQ